MRDSEREPGNEASSATYCSCKECEQLLESTRNFVDALNAESIGKVRVPQRLWRVDTTAQGHHTRDLSSC